jgi:hypothetical protein
LCAITLLPPIENKKRPITVDVPTVYLGFGDIDLF